RWRRLDAELLGQGVAGVLESAPGLRLPIAPGQPDHELLPAVLAPWLRLHPPNQRVHAQPLSAHPALYAPPPLVLPPSPPPHPGDVLQQPRLVCQRSPRTAAP